MRGLWDTRYDADIWPDRATYRGSFVGQSRRLGYYAVRFYVVLRGPLRRWLRRYYR